MVRFYRLVVCIDGRYELVDYFLDLSEASAKALDKARSLCAKNRAVVTQIDVYPSCSVSRPIVCVDGMA